MDTFLYCFILLDTLQNASFMGLGLLPGLCVMLVRSEGMIRGKGGTQQGERVSNDLTSQNVAQPSPTRPGGSKVWMFFLWYVRGL